jgi:hypothetical protein
MFLFIHPSKGKLKTSGSSLSVGLLNGGFCGLFWVFIGTVLCYSTIVASLTEMESMAPTSGGKSIKFLVFLAFLQTKLKYLRPISLRFRFCSCGVPKDSLLFSR